MFGLSECVLLVLLVHILSGMCFEVSLVQNEFPTVTTNLGEIQGRYLISRLNNTFLAFRGIRYAESPVGNLRFQPPVSVKPWNEIFDATKDGPACIQGYDFFNTSEDCLRLNVYTRDVASDNKKPVIIYFHPGGFYAGSGQSTVAGPEHLMDYENIVLVTANYRLGILGFLSTGTKDAPGNVGYKDQVVAMKWVRDNIEKFGGDPNSVTLLGYSAGAFSITLHLISPMAQGLFHRAIVMSGSAVSQWDMPYDQIDLAKKQARLLNCSDETVEDIMNCLKGASAKDLAKTAKSMFEFGYNPVLLYKPVIEQDFGQERFLTQDPTCLIKNGQFAKVEILTGITEYEFLNPAIDILKNDELRMRSHFTTLAPICFLYERDTLRSEQITSRLRRDFFGNSTSNDWLTFDGLKDLFADSLISFSMDRFARLASAHTKVYQYKFTYSGRYSHTYYPVDKPYGAVHHDELIYLFRAPFMTPLLTKTDPENPIIEMLTGWWTNFANTYLMSKTIFCIDFRSPNSGGYISSTEWEKLDPNSLRYLEINKNPTMKGLPFTKRFKTWDDLFSVDVRCKDLALISN